MRFLSLLLMVILLSCCRGGGEEGGSGTYKIAMLKGPSAMGMILMADSLQRASSATDISVDIYTEPMQVRKAMLEGSADFAALPMNIAAVLHNKGLEYSLAAVPVAGSLYLAGSDSSIHDWEDLRGRKVYIMARGMTPDILFRYLLSKNGLLPDEDVTLDYSFPTHTDIASAMAAGRVPLGVITEPYLSSVMMKNGDIRPILDLNGEWIKVSGGSIAETAFMVKTSLLREQPKVVERVLNSYESSSEWVENHPDSAAVLLVRHGIISDIAAARRAISYTHLVFWRAQDKKEEIDAYLRTLYEMSPEIIGGKMPDEEFYQ